MVLSALARRGSASETGLALGLAEAVGRVLPELTGAELAMVVHAGGQLALGGLAQVLSSLSAAGEEGGHPTELLGVLRAGCSASHAALLLHGLAKLQLQPIPAAWELLQLLPGNILLDNANAVRAVLAAARADWRDNRLRQMARDAGADLANLGEEAVASLIYAQLHPYYFEEIQLHVLLRHVWEHREIQSQSFALQVRVALVGLQLLQGVAQRGRPGLATCRALKGLAADTEARPSWTRELLSRRSELQAEVEHVVRERCRCSRLVQGEEEEEEEQEDGREDGLHCEAEVLIWPFSLDLLVQPAPAERMWRRL